MDAWATMQELATQDNKDAIAVWAIIMAAHHTDGERATELDRMLRTRDDFPEALAKLLRRDHCTGEGAAATRPTPDATEDAQGHTLTISQQKVAQTRPVGQKHAGDNIEELRNMSETHSAASAGSVPSTPTNATSSMQGDGVEGHALSTTTICKGQGGTLVRCSRDEVVCPPGADDPLDITPYVQKCTNTTFRRMAWCVLIAPGRRIALDDSWHELRTALKSDANGFSMIMADTRANHTVLLYKGAGGIDKQIKAGQAWQSYKLSSKDPVPFAKLLLRCTAAILTIALEEPQTLTQMTAMEAIQPYMKLDEVAFKSILIDLKEQKRLGKKMRPEAEFLVNHPKDMEQLKQLLLKKDRMRSMLKDTDSALRFPHDFQLTPQTMRLFRICPHTMRREISERPADAILDAVGLYTIVFFGAPGKGKTPCARALAALYSQAQGKTKFIETQTADSLRKLAEFDLLEEGCGIVLDEWQPRQITCGPQGGGVEHVKNMLDPADAKTIEARFNDFAVPESCARFVTVQNLGKLMLLLEGVSADSDERELRGIVGENDDIKAVLKRCIVVEVRDHLIKQELREEYRDTRCSKGPMMREMANQLCREGERPLTTQLGLWRPCKDAAGTTRKR